MVDPKSLPDIPVRKHDRTRVEKADTSPPRKGERFTFTDQDVQWFRVKKGNPSATPSRNKPPKQG
jgi:hypothetical protein